MAMMLYWPSFQKVHDNRSILMIPTRPLRRRLRFRLNVSTMTILYPKLG